MGWNDQRTDRGTDANAAIHRIHPPAPSAPASGSTIGALAGGARKTGGQLRRACPVRARTNRTHPVVAGQASVDSPDRFVVSNLLRRPSGARHLRVYFS